MSPNLWLLWTSQRVFKVVCCMAFVELVFDTNLVLLVYWQQSCISKKNIEYFCTHRLTKRYCHPPVGDLPLGFGFMKASFIQTFHSLASLCNALSMSACHTKLRQNRTSYRYDYDARNSILAWGENITVLPGWVSYDTTIWVYPVLNKRKTRFFNHNYFPWMLANAQAFDESSSLSSFCPIALHNARNTGM